MTATSVAAYASITCETAVDILLKNNQICFCQFVGPKPEDIESCVVVARDKCNTITSRGQALTADALIQELLKDNLICQKETAWLDAAVTMRNNDSQRNLAGIALKQCQDAAIVSISGSFSGNAITLKCTGGVKHRQGPLIEKKGIYTAHYEGAIFEAVVQSNNLVMTIKNEDGDKIASSVAAISATSAKLTAYFLNTYPSMSCSL